MLLTVKKKETWYDRTLVVRASSFQCRCLQRGEHENCGKPGIGRDEHYTVEVKLEGGSGRTTVETPTQLKIEMEGNGCDHLGSSHYDYMKVGEEI